MIYSEFKTEDSKVKSGCESSPITAYRLNAWSYYTGTVYPGWEESLEKIKDGELSHGIKVPVGYAAPSGLNGTYFFSPNCNGPFSFNMLVPEIFVPVCKT